MASSNDNMESGTQVSQGLGGVQVPSQGDRTSRTAQTQKVTNKPIKGKRKRRQSKEEAKLMSQIEALVSISNRALEILLSDGSVSKHGSAGSTIAEAMTVINRMVTKCYLEEGSELWCFAACLIENDIRREIFLNMEDDSRKAWLMYMHAKER